MTFDPVPIPPEVERDLAKLTTTLIDLKDSQIQVQKVSMKVKGDARMWTLSQGKRPTPSGSAGGKGQQVGSDGIHCYFDGDGEPALCGYDDY